MVLSLLLAASLMAGKGPTTLYFSGGEKSAWQQVTANGQILGPVPGTPLAPKTPACYGMWRLLDGSIAVATDHFYLLSADLQRKSTGMVAVETIAGASGRHLYRIRRGAKLKRKPPQVEHSAHLDEIDPRAWKVTRSWLLPGVYSAFGEGHLSVNVEESLAYYATELHPQTGAVEAMGTVHRFDLRKGEALPDLVSRTAHSGGLQVLAGGSIVVGYTDQTHRYAPDGALLQTAPGALRVGQGLVASGADASSFWVQGFSDSTLYSTLFEIGLDGTVRHEWNTPNNGVLWDAPFVDPPTGSCVPAGSLAFTDNGIGGGPVPIYYLAPTTFTTITVSSATVPESFADGFDDGDFATDFDEVYEGCTITKIGDWSGFPGRGTIRTNYTDRVYQAYSLTGPVRTGVQHILKDGTVHRYSTFSIMGASALTQIQEVAVGTADDVAYYKVNPADADATQKKTVYRYDLVGDADLGAWVSEATRELRNAANLLVLRDGTVLVGWSGAGATTSVVKHYASDGTLLHTYSPTNATNNEPFSLVAERDDDSFWVSYVGAAEYATLARIDVSSGSIVDFHEFSNAELSAIFTATGLLPDFSGGGFVVTREDCNCMACPDPCEDAGVGEPYWALAPEFTNTYFYDRKWTSPPFSTLSTPGACQIAPNGSSHVWIAMDDTPNSTSILYLVDPSTIDSGTGEATIIQVITSVLDENGSPITIGELGGYHALFVLSCQRLLTVDRTTHDVVILCLPAPDTPSGTATVERRLSLNINPLDAQLVDDGDDLLYLDGGVAKLWNIPNDALLRTIGSVGGIWPVVLSDNSFLVFTGSFRTNGEVLRYTRTGSLIRRFTYNAGYFSVGLYNISADIETDICGCGNKKDGAVVLVGEEDPRALTLNLLDGSLPGATTGGGGVPGVLLGDVTQGGVDTAAALAIVGAPASAGNGFGDIGGSNGRRPVPNRHCGPEAGVNSPAPNPGCNAGGKGWTKSYLGPSGVVPAASDPAGEETLTGKNSIFVDVEVQHTNAPGGPAEVFRWALVDLDDTTRKEGRIRSLGDVSNGSGDGQGNLEAADGNIQIFDAPDYPIGSRVLTQFFARDEVLIRARSDAGRRAGATPRMIGRGLLYGESYGGERVAQLRWVDPVFIDGGSFSPDKPDSVNFPLSYYTQAPKDLAHVQMRYYGGEVSDEGAISPVTGLLNSRGKCSAFWVGPDVLGTAGGGEAWERFNLSLFAMADILGVYGSDCGGLGIYGRAAVVSTVETSDNEDVEATSEITRVALDGAPDLSHVADDGTMQIVLWTTTGRTEAVIIAVDNFAKTVDIEINVTPSVAQGVAWYISSIDYVPRRVKLDLATRNGVDLMVPHWAGYIRPTPYEDFTCADGAFRVTDMWARGCVAEAHKAGEVTIAFNPLGIEDQGDGTGTVINDFFTFDNWFWDNRIHQPVTKPAGPGNLWAQVAADLPAYTDGVSKTKSSDFATAQAQTVLSLGGNGLPISATFGEGRSLRDVVQLFNDNGGCRHVIDEYGRVGVWLLNQFADTSAWPRIEHVSRVFGDVRRFRALDEAMNVVKGGTDWDPEGQQFREDDMEAVSTAAIARNHGIKRTSKHYDLRFIADKPAAQYLLDRVLAVQQDGPNYVVIENGDIGLLDHAVGSGILFSSPLLPGSTETGMTDRKLVILRKTFHVDSHLVSLVCLDVEDLLIPESQQFILTDDPTGPILSDDDSIAPVLAA